MAGSVTDSLDDLALMQAIARRDTAALGVLYDRHSPMLLAICRRVLRSAEDSEEVLLDVFTEVWTKSDRYDADRANPLTYLITLTRSRSIDRSRSKASRPRITSDYTDASAMTDPVTGPLDSTDLKERQKLVRKALSDLEGAQREVVECAFYEGLSHSEIAEKLNRPLGTVKTYIRQGLIRLRQSLRSIE